MPDSKEQAPKSQGNKPKVRGYIIPSAKQPRGKGRPKVYLIPRADS